MKTRFLTLLGCALLVFQAHAATKPDTLSYSMGYQIGSRFKQDNFPIKEASFLNGFQTGYKGKKSLFTSQEMRAAIITFQKKLFAANQAKMAKMGKKNLTVGSTFLAKNKAKKGVTTLPNGLQYKIIKPGVGKKPKATDTVTVDYEGTLINGTVFDSSYKRGKPAQFQVKALIPGWTQALQMMKEGAVWMLYIPANLAYGPRATGPIPPNSVLIFKLHLIKID